MHPMLNTAITAARQAGNIIARSADRIETLTIKNKGQNDFVSEIDQQAEQAIIKVIRKAYPSHGFLAEESGNSAGDDYVWIIDPLDGTTNFLHGFPQFAVSIALKYKNRLEQAVIYDPIRQELFTASRGVNAQLNGRRIRVTKAKSLANTLIGTGFPYSNMEHLSEYMDILKSIIPETVGVRRAGAASLDLAYVAAGRLDGFWEYGLKPWDLAAGTLLIQEAGGIVSDFDGGTDFFESGNVVAGNAKVLKSLLQTIKRHQS
ncbi:Inositol-1-monophosphatase [hydrothermal vent metagenome]|uniref:inositol-phosphate phosphatase n=1 Tax=hydrothermal vent metagenome TaxID=652676 RepID=A0A3B0ZDZ6_9ZZZZ